MEEATTASISSALKKRVKLTRKAYQATRKEYGEHKFELVQAYEAEHLGDSELSGDETTMKRRKLFHLMNDI